MEITHHRTFIEGSRSCPQAEVSKQTVVALFAVKFANYRAI